MPASGGNDYRPFEGMWLATRPAGAVACAKFTGGRLLIPYSFSGMAKLAGHHYDCRVTGNTLVCRFEQFDTAVAGVLLLATGPNHTLVGCRWMNEQVPDAIRENLSNLTESLPGMESTVWLRMSGSVMPSWAEKYFKDDWPIPDSA